MKVTIHTKDGISERSLTNAEVLSFAKNGNQTAKKEILIKELDTASTIQDEIDAIIKFLTETY